MKVEGQQVERRRRENRGAEGGIPLPDGEGDVPPRQKIFNFLFRFSAFWVQSDAFSDITRPVLKRYTHILQRAQISLSLPVPNWVRDAGHILKDFSLVWKRG